MNKESEKIVKLAPVAASTSSAINYYVLRMKEILHIPTIANIPKKLVFVILGCLLVAAVSFYSLFSVAFSNNFRPSVYQLARISQHSNYAQHDILSNYLNTMTMLILEANPQQIQQKSPVFRAITQATLQELDPEYKRYIILFLQDANLLQISTKEESSLLWGANLSGVNLQGLNLTSANLQGANLENVDFRGANLHGVKLKNANLENACYNSSTVFDHRFQPNTEGMKEIKASQKCF
ncbi:MAG TPA: pentapeptide repeat-containing protein [Nostocaceae cyanobacterium]|nr:pentapeptide repeat-containing protein [Nostocaceae cyanobacterium]